MPSISRYTLRFALTVLAAAIAATAGQVAQGLCLLLACIAACVVLCRQGLRLPVGDRKPWLALAVAMGSWLTSAVMGAVFPSATEPQGNWLASTEYFDCAAYCAAISAAALFGRRRSHHQDPTNWLDALAVTVIVAVFSWTTVLVPNLTTDSLSTGRQLINCIFGLLDLILFAAVTRLAVGPGARNRSYYLLFGFNVCVLASDALVSLEQAKYMFPGQEKVLVALMTVGFSCAAFAALASDSRQLTRSGDAPIGRMTTARAILMSAAVIVPPCVIIGTGTYKSLLSGGVAVLWFLAAGLVMARFAGLVRARELESKNEWILSRAAAALASATNHDAMYQGCLSAVVQLWDSGACRASVLFVHARKWSVRAADGIEIDGLANGVSEDSTREMLNGLSTATQSHSRSLTVGADLKHVVLVPLIVHGRLRGALALETAVPSSSDVLARIERLSTDLSLAVEADLLTENLHRQQSEQRFRSLVQQSHDLVMIIAPDGAISYVSPACQTLLGVDETVLYGNPFSKYLAAPDRPVLSAAVASASCYGASSDKIEVSTVADVLGKRRILELAITDLRGDPFIAGYVVNAHDITERRALEEDLRHKVLHDDLTGIANRVLLRERIQHALAGRARSKRSAAVVFVDLDDFKTINDGLGHAVGDELLQTIAFRLDQYVRDGDTAARLGGDEFALVLEDVLLPEDAFAVAERILEIIEQPVYFGDRQISVTASLGIAMADNQANADVLLRNADVAMYHAKQSGKRKICTFDESMYVSAFERLELKGDLTKALDGRELTLFYQPIFTFEGQLLGFEALIRWIHPTRGFVNPGSFIPLAEETGLIVPIGRWVLEEALTQLSEWQKQSPMDRLTMNVNLAPRQLHEESIVESVRELLNASEVDPSTVILELTESEIVEDEASSKRLDDLRDLGVGIAADDFGSGFASYAALSQLPFTIIKLDRSLIDRLSGSIGNVHVQVRSIIEMAHATGLQVVAEGIENAAQKDALAAMGCDKAQGFYFGRPMPSAEAQALLRNQRQQPLPG